MGILFLLALIGGSPILALLCFGSMWLDASAKDDRERERRHFEIEESRHRDNMRRSHEIEDKIRSSAITRASSDYMSDKDKTPAKKRQRTRSIIKYPDGTIETRETITEIIP